MLVSAGEAISPYAGTLGGTAVTLFCDDFNDDVPMPSTFNVNISAPNGGVSNMRFGTTNYNAAYPSGTALYEEIAWLFTQMMGSGQTQANQIGIQEAVWHMTASTPGSVSTTSLSNTGSNLTYLQWITDAASDYRKTVNGFTTPDYTNWMILSDVNIQTPKLRRRARGIRSFSPTTRQTARRQSSPSRLVQYRSPARSACLLSAWDLCWRA